MKTVRDQSTQRSRNALAGVAAALCLGFAAGNALADGYWVSAPSTLRVGETAPLAGGGYAPGTVVTLKVTPPTGNGYEQSVAVEADGTLAQQLPLREDGQHTVEVLDAQGKVLAFAILGVAR